MTTQLVATKVGDAYDIYAVRNSERVKIGSVVHGQESVIEYRGCCRSVMFHRRWKLKNVLSPIRFFVDGTDTMESVEAFQNKVRRTA